MSSFKTVQPEKNAVLLGKISTDAEATRQIADMLSSNLKSEGRSDAFCDVNANVERLATVRGTRSNEVMHTGNTGYGAELIPASVMSQDFLDFVPAYSSIVGAFAGGFHGRNLPKTLKVPAIGKLGFHNLASQWTTGAGAAAQGNKRLPTDIVELDQQTFEASVDISDQEIRYSVVDVVALLQSKLAVSAAQTIESYIINGDIVTAASGNVNSDDGAPAATDYYLGADGLRKKFLAAAKDVGSLTFDDLVDVMRSLGLNAANPADLVFIMNPQTLYTLAKMEDFKFMFNNGAASTIVSGIKSIANVLGANVLSSQFLGLTEADGKISVTPSNNTKGGYLCVHKNAVQYGFGKDYTLELYRVPGKGYQILGSYDMGLAVASKLAGETDATGALAINATL